MPGCGFFISVSNPYKNTAIGGWGGPTAFFLIRAELLHTSYIVNIISSFPIDLVLHFTYTYLLSSLYQSLRIELM